MKLSFQFRFIGFLLILKLCSASLPRLGEKCNITGEEEYGTCKLLNNCPSANEIFRINRVLPQACHPYSLNVVVCCSPVVKPVKKSNSLTKCQEYNTDATCGIKPLREIPLNGNHLKAITDFPYIASIQYRTDTDHSLRKIQGDQGILISSRYVICAAASLFKRNRIPGTVLLGTLDQRIWVDDETVEYDIEKTIAHPDYQPPAIYNGIGLIKLSKQVKFTQYIRPICLPDTDIEALPDVVYRINFEVTDTSRSLVKYERKPVPSQICNATYDISYAPNGINDNFICTISKELGDSNYDYRFDGAPITIDNPSVACSHVLLGVSQVSMDFRISDAAINVYKYREWIESIVWAEGEDANWRSVE